MWNVIMRREVKSGKTIKTRACRRTGSSFFLKPVFRVHDASETTEETEVAAASCNEGVKTSETETPAPQLLTN
jgi:hypothetical protein